MSLYVNGWEYGGKGFGGGTGTGTGTGNIEVAYLKDVKPSNSYGGTFTAGSWQTRTLNTTEGDIGIVTLASNQFTLATGTYDIYATAPAFKVYANKIRIWNVTDSTEAILGGHSRADNGENSPTNAALVGQISITSSKTFILQHRCATTVGTSGFGTPCGFSGVNEVYAQVKITKLR